MRVRDGPDASAVIERLMDREVEPVLPLLECRSIERALSPRGGEAATGGAAPDRSLGTDLDEESLDPPVGGSLERRGPARRGAPLTCCGLAPAFERLALALGPPVLEQWKRNLEELRRR